MAGEFNRRVKSFITLLMVLSGYGLRWKNLTAAGVTNIGKSGSVIAHLNVNTTAAGTIILRDGSEVIGTFKASLAEGHYPIRAYCKNQPVIELAAASDVTIFWAA